MDPSTMNMVIPAIKVRGKKARTPPTLDIKEPVTANPGASVKQVAIPNAKKAQKVSMQTAPETISGDQIYGDTAKRVKKVGKAVSKLSEKIHKDTMKKAGPEEAKKMEEDRKAMKERHAKELKSVRAEVRAEKDAPVKQAMMELVEKHELSPKHIKEHIAFLRSEHKKQLAEDIALYRANVKLEKSELRKMSKDGKKKE